MSQERRAEITPLIKLLQIGIQQEYIHGYTISIRYEVLTLSYILAINHKEKLKFSFSFHPLRDPII